MWAGITNKIILADIGQSGKTMKLKLGELKVLIMVGVYKHSQTAKELVDL